MTVDALTEAQAARSELRASDAWKRWGSDPSTHVFKCGQHLDACISALQPAPVPPPATSALYYAADSPWNTPIPKDVAVSSQSASWISALYNAVGDINVNQGSWTPTRLIAADTDPRRRFNLDNGWLIDNVPVPGNLLIEAESDAHGCIVDPKDGIAFDFFGLSRDSASPSGWRAKSGTALPLDGSGWWDGSYTAGGLSGPWGARASGASLLGGLILADDVKAGRIPHALGAAAPKQLIGPPVTPARTGDGGGVSAAMPMGSRLQLDPAFDLSTLDPGTRLVAAALQTYGVYITDSSSSLALYAENYKALPGGLNPYPASWSAGLSRELIRHLRVVAAPPTPVYANRATLGQPHK